MNFHEVLLWQRLRQGRLRGLHFRRQHSVGRWFVDFACLSKRLAIEVDGLTHVDPVRDLARDAALESLGWRVLRVMNDDLLRDLDGVIRRIEAAALASLERKARRR